MDGHIAIIAGLDDQNIYIAESLPRGVVITTHSLEYGGDNPIYYSSIHDYIMLMDSYYEAEGVYDQMWTQLPCNEMVPETEADQENDVATVGEPA